MLYFQIDVSKRKSLFVVNPLSQGQWKYEGKNRHVHKSTSWIRSNIPSGREQRDLRPFQALPVHVLAFFFLLVFLRTLMLVRTLYVGLLVTQVLIMSLNGDRAGIDGWMMDDPTSLHLPPSALWRPPVVRLFHGYNYSAVDAQTTSRSFSSTTVSFLINSQCPAVYRHVHHFPTNGCPPPPQHPLQWRVFSVCELQSMFNVPWMLKQFSFMQKQLQSSLLSIVRVL